MTISFDKCDDENDGMLVAHSFIRTVVGGWRIIIVRSDAYSIIYLISNPFLYTIIVLIIRIKNIQEKTYDILL